MKHLERNLFLLVALGVLAALFSGCSTLSGAAVQEIKADPNTRTDALAALEVAKVAGDSQGALCYTSILAHLPDTAAAALPDAGALTAFEKLRVARMKAEEGISVQTKNACAPLIMDAQGSVLKLLGSITTLGR